ncbi:MAG: hypothetical protein ACPGGN_04515, partial [Opitutales bacterium]
SGVRIPPPMPSGQGSWILTYGGPVRVAAGLVGLTAGSTPKIGDKSDFLDPTISGYQRVAIRRLSFMRPLIAGSKLLRVYGRWHRSAVPTMDPLDHSFIN